MIFMFFRMASNDKGKKKCEFCQELFLSTSLLRHISRSSTCKDYYGDRFEGMKAVNRIKSYKKYDLKIQKQNVENQSKR